MCMDAYFEGILIRERIAEAQRQAARRHLLGQAKLPRKPSRGRTVIERLVLASSVPWMKRLRWLGELPWRRTG